MSRKSKLQSSRLDELDRRLQGLYRQGADEAFIDLVQDRSGDACRCPAAGLYGEVVDRALRRALAAGDLVRSERIWRRLLRDARARPLALAAAAACHLAAGRAEEARRALDELAAGGAASGGDAAGEPAPASLVARLAALATPMAARGAGEAEGSGEPELPDRGGLETPEAQAVSRFYRGLAAVGAGGPPATAEITALGRNVATLRAACGGDRAAADLLADADRCLQLLGLMASAETAIRHSRRGRPAGKSSGGMESFFEVARQVARPLLAVLRAERWPPLLEPLRQALRGRWRSLLAWVAEQPDAAAAWAELHAISPPLLALELEVGAGSSPEGGMQEVRRWIQARSLLAAQSFAELARWLAQAARNEPQPGRLAQLWSLELWAWDREEAKALADEEGDVVPGRAFLGPDAARPLASELNRLEQMATWCRQRIPADQQPEVARVLAAQLVQLCQAVRFGRSMAAAAESLLLHLPDDPGLLVVGLAGAACSSNVEAAKRFAVRIAARGQAGATDQETVLRLVSEIVMEQTGVAVAVLLMLRPLLPEEAWPRVQSLLAQELAAAVRGSCRYDLDLDFRRLRQDLELCRDKLGDAAELTALAAAVDCIDPAGGGDGRSLRQVLERLPGLEPALTALRVLAVANTHAAARPAEAALQECRRLAVDRLDERWRLWQPVLPALVIGADPRQRRRLREMVMALRRRRDVSEADRKAYEEILTEMDLLARLQRHTRRVLGWLPPLDPTAGPEAGRRQARGEGEPRRKRPKAAADDQLDLDF